MAIFIYHGNGLSSMNTKIISLKKEFDSLSVLEFSGKDTDWDQMINIISTPQLFSEKRLVILEDYDDKVDLKKLPNDNELTIVVKLAKNLGEKSSLLNNALNLKARVINFSEKDEVSVFPFLDALAEKKTKALYQLDKLNAEYGDQYILTMIFYMLRRMILPQQKLSYASKQKIETQKRNFTEDEISEIYRYALDLDYKSKAGLIDKKLVLSLIINKIISK